MTWRGIADLLNGRLKCQEDIKGLKRRLNPDLEVLSCNDMTWRSIRRLTEWEI